MSMTTWERIACERGHEQHFSRVVPVNLGGPTAYADLPAIPERLARSFEMTVWDTDIYPVSATGPWCPAHDAVSETITALGVWEPSETALVLSVCEAAEDGAPVVDYGAQIGWFSLLAASAGCTVRAIDADREPLRLLAESAILNGWEEQVSCAVQRVDWLTPDLPAFDALLVKVDVEGAENEVLRVISDSLDEGRIEHLLIEISPCFADYYPDLVESLIRRGYHAYALPEKARPPASLEELPGALTRLDLLPREALRSYIENCHQINAWFATPEAVWQ